MASGDRGLVADCEYVTTALVHGSTLLVALTFGQTAMPSGTSPSITINGHRLWLGMPQQAVFSELGEEYDLQKVKGREWWQIMPKSPHHRASVSSIHFDKGKLVVADKEWLPGESDDGVAVANALFGAFSELEREGNSRCELSTQFLPPVPADDHPTPEAKVANVNCTGHKLIYISVMRQSGQDWVSVTETVR